jgi:Cu/Ag efflux pump CusA
LDILYQKAQECAKHIAKIEGVGDLKVQQIEGVQMVVDYNREKIAQYGLKIKELNALVKTAFAGEEAGVVYEGEKRFGLVVRLDSAYRKDLQNISDLYVDLPNGVKFHCLRWPIFHIRTLLPKLLVIMHAVVLQSGLMFVTAMLKAWCMKYNRY